VSAQMAARTTVSTALLTKASGLPVLRLKRGHFAVVAVSLVSRPPVSGKRTPGLPGISGDGWWRARSALCEPARERPDLVETPHTRPVCRRPPWELHPVPFADHGAPAACGPRSSVPLKASIEYEQQRRKRTRPSAATVSASTSFCFIHCKCLVSVGRHDDHPRTTSALNSSLTRGKPGLSRRRAKLHEVQTGRFSHRQ
jgi:hypothetical protein